MVQTRGPFQTTLSAASLLAYLLGHLLEFFKSLCDSKCLNQAAMLHLATRAANYRPASNRFLALICLRYSRCPSINHGLLSTEAIIS